MALLTVSVNDTAGQAATRERTDLGIEAGNVESRARDVSPSFL